jgi:molybdopterin synthase catalytic subunit
MDASQYIVEQIKQRVAVWKKEVYEDGSHWWVKQCC